MTDKTRLTFASCLLALLGAPATADPAEVVTAKASQNGSSWRVDVTLRHGDTGWEDYADGWRVEAPDGTVLGTRVLYHPHVEEQPFTRALTGVTLPPQLSEVHIRARTNTDGWAETTFILKLP
ncbi:MAG: hypothetical protein AAGF50_07055 [Pseudomonadota bacterium]